MEEQAASGLAEQPAIIAPPTGSPFRSGQQRMTSRNRRLVDLAAIALAVLAAVTVATGINGPVRWILVGAAVLFVPGAAIAPVFRVEDSSSYAALAVMLSLAVNTLGATVMVWLHWFHPLILGAALGAASCLALLLDHRRLSRTPDGDLA